MSGRLSKQFIYGTAFLLLLCAIGFVVYRASLPAPGCSNGRADRGEEGIDCGGICTRACLPLDLLPLVSGEAKIFHSAPGALAVLVRVTNSNPNWTADRVGYSLALYGDGGESLGELRGETLVYGRQVRYIAAFSKDAAADQVVRAVLTLAEPEWLPMARLSPPALALEQRMIATSTTGLEVRGRVSSNDTLLLPPAEALAVFYDRYGFTAGVSRTELGSLAPGAAADFVVLHPPLPGVDLSRTEVLIYSRRPVL